MEAAYYWIQNHLANDAEVHGFIKEKLKQKNIISQIIGMLCHFFLMLDVAKSKKATIFELPEMHWEMVTIICDPLQPHPNFYKVATLSQWG